ncbi:MAG: DUF86 domain-containing protein [Bacteroidales bacterium]|jgi:uncharacterized protein with HEPN domain|nr:DUF86 domain-containing protein [Bacteroidales bacterium]
MCDKELILDILENIECSLQEITEWMKDIKTIDDFVCTQHGTLLRNGVCMKILAIGEELKSIDKRTKKQLLKKYPVVDWTKVMGMRDIIAHHYFEVDAEIVFNAAVMYVPQMSTCIKQIKKDVSTKL